jgi:FkbM family methyltransferase
MESYSQAGQDIWVSKVFKNNIQEECFFLDVGANDGITFSNTNLLSKLGWKGILVEANRAVFLKLLKNRREPAYNFAISDKVGLCGFVDDELIGRIKVGASHIAVTFSEILRNAPKRIQYLSLDIEGHELEALSGFPFDEYTIDLITVEHNSYHVGDKLKKDIYNLLTKNGYMRVKEDVLVDGLLPFEDWYCHKSFKK